MIRNYLLTAVRNISRQKLSSTLNILGLSIGIACFLLISLWIIDELSFDRFHERKDRIYRVNSMTKDMGLVTTSSWRLGPALKNDYPEIEAYTRLWPWGRSLVRSKEKVFDESRISLADPAFFKIFSFNFIVGSAQSALQDKYAIILTAATAEKYFGNENPLGKTLYLRQFEHDFKVYGVIENIPSNSSIQFDLMARVDLMGQQRLNSWEFTGYTVIMLDEWTSKNTMDLKIKSFYKAHVNERTDSYPFLQPFTEVHLYLDGTPGMVKMVRNFSIIAIFILLLACINFMNLRTAKSTRRALEVGIRKTMGAKRRQLIIQFLSESLLIAFISLFAGILLLELSLPFFNQIVLKQLNLFSPGLGSLTLLLIATTIITGFLAGSYPAFYLSAFRPVKVFKNASPVSGAGNTFRKALTIFQFSISIGLIICVLIWQLQLRYIQNKNIGIKKEFVVNIIANQDIIANFESYRNELLNNPNIESVSAAASTPFNIGSFIGINWEGHLDQEQVVMPYNMVDFDFFKTLGMEIVQGRTFSRLIPSDKTEACIINETAARIMGFDSPIGKEIYFNHPAFAESYKKVKIIGVVNDFHAHSLHEPLVPSIFRMHSPFLSYIYVKIHPGSNSSTINYIKKINETFAPEYPFSFEFMNKTYDHLYEMEIRMGAIIRIFTFLAIFVSCLGLFGLALYTIEKRTKEIGIRKILGASVVQITSMLSVEFLKWVILANLIAWPLAWHFMQQWLRNFVYHIDISLFIFISAGMIGVILAFLTVIFQSMKAAMRNPVETLRYE